MQSIIIPSRGADGWGVRKHKLEVRFHDEEGFGLPEIQFDSGMEEMVRHNEANYRDTGQSRALELSSN